MLLKRRSIVLWAVALSALGVAVSANAARDTSMDIPEIDFQNLAQMMDERNAALEAEGADYRVMHAEIFSVDVGQDTTVFSSAAQEVLAKDTGNKKLDQQFVPGDRRRWWNSNPGNTLTYAIHPWMFFVSPQDVENRVDSAMSSWNDVKCFHKVSIEKTDPYPFQNSNPPLFNGPPTADIIHAGFAIFSVSRIIAVQFTWFWRADDDGNGYYDKFFGEIYYNFNKQWSFDGRADIDFQTVALHESGHGLGVAHFGKVVKKKGKIRAAPRAVMNAAYVGPLQEISGTDQAGICGLYASWPGATLWNQKQGLKHRKKKRNE